MLPDGFSTARLLLRTIEPRDAGPIFDGYAQDREVTRFLTWRPHLNLAETDAYITHCTAMPHAGWTYVLVDRQNNVVLGAFDLRLPSPHRLDFGYVLARAHWGQGLMTEALAGVVAWALAHPSIFRIGAVCDVQNIQSARVMEKAGLTREGLLRRWLVHPNMSDEPRDCFSFGRVR